MNVSLSLRNAGLVTATLLLCGCATSPDSLKTPVAAGNIELPNGLNFDVPNKISNSAVRVSLAPGYYKAWKQGAGGTYYMGPPKCYGMTVTKAGWAYQKEMVGKQVTAVDCGLFISSSKGRPPKIFTIISSGTTPEPDPVATQAMLSTQPALQGAPIASGIGAGIGYGIVAAIIASEQGKIGFALLQPPGTMLQDAIGQHAPVQAAAAAPATASAAPNNPPQNLLAVDAAR